MEIFNKKTSVLRASKKNAEFISKRLLAFKTAKGKPVFTRGKIDNGFIITGKKTINKVLQDCIVFRYTNNNGKHLIEWDAGLVALEFND